MNSSSYATSNNSKFELLKIVPNPASSEVIISGYSNSLQSLVIRDVLGKTIYLENLKSENGMIKINVSKFYPGNYFVKIIDNNNQIKLGKFVVAR